MRRVSLDATSATITEFLRRLPREPVELEAGGEVICTVMPGAVAGEVDSSDLLQRGRELVERARRRNQGASSEEIKREVRAAVESVRRRRIR